MLRNRKWLAPVSAIALMAGLSIAAAALNGPPRDWTPVKEAAVAASFAPAAYPVDDAEKAAIGFVRAMAASDAEAVWMYASEEEQDAFGTEKAALEAYAEEFPALIHAKTVLVTRDTQEGDTPFVDALVTDRNGRAYQATFGFWLSDSGDWQLISCEVTPASDRVAGL